MAEISLPWKENWSRAYRFTIGTREYTKDLYNQEDFDLVPEALRRPRTEADSVTIPSNALMYSNLTSDGFSRRGFHFELDVTQKLSSSSKDAEKSTLKLYNPNQEMIDVMMQDRCIVIAELGYGQQVSLAYSGDVDYVTADDRGADTIYTLEMKSGGLAMRDTTVSLYYDESVSEQDIITDLAQRFPATALGTYGLNDQSGRYKSGGRGFTGSLITNFDNIMAKNNLSYVHINGKIVITPYRLVGSDYDKFSATNYNIPYESIKSISDVTDKTKNSSTSTQNKLRKLNIICQYLPVEVGQFITVPDDADEYKGTYQVKARRISASSRPNSAYNSILQVEEIA